MNRTRAVEVSIHAVSPLLSSANAGKEKKLNPRLQVESVDQYIEIMNNLNLQKPVSLDFNISSNLKLGAI